MGFFESLKKVQEADRIISITKRTGGAVAVRVTNINTLARTKDLIESAAEAVDVIGEDELEKDSSYLRRVMANTRDPEERAMDAQDLEQEMREQRGEYEDE